MSRILCIETGEHLEFLTSFAEDARRRKENIYNDERTIVFEESYAKESGFNVVKEEFIVNDHD